MYLNSVDALVPITCLGGTLEVCRPSSLIRLMTFDIVSQLSFTKHFHISELTCVCEKAAPHFTGRNWSWDKTQGCPVQSTLCHHLLSVSWPATT